MNEKIKRKAHVKQSFSLDFLERGTFTEYPYLFLFLRNKHRQIGDASYQYCIQQMNLLKRLIDEMADNGIDGNREAYIKSQHQKRF